MPADPSCIPQCQLTQKNPSDTQSLFFIVQNSGEEEMWLLLSLELGRVTAAIIQTQILILNTAW